MKQHTRREVFGLFGAAAVGALIGPTVVETLAGASEATSSDVIIDRYLNGQPVYGELTQTADGTPWAPVLTRVMRNGRFYGTFSSPDNRLWAFDEIDGAFYRIIDFYDTSTWTLGTVEDAWWLQSIAWLIAHIVQVVMGALLFAVFVIFVVFLVLYWKSPRMEASQLDYNLLSPNGVRMYYDAYPGFRSEIQKIPGLTEGLFNNGFITMP